MAFQNVALHVKTVVVIFLLLFSCFIVKSSLNNVMRSGSNMLENTPVKLFCLCEILFKKIEKNFKLLNM